MDSFFQQFKNYGEFMKKQRYPFSAIVGQDELQLAIILNVINPKLGGLLIKGVKGSGKSSSVYAIPDILPELEIMQYCEFNCDPATPDSWCKDCAEQYTECTKESEVKNIQIVSIPLSVTEDRLLGTVDVEKLLKEGEHSFIPGILAKAHRQILYIDEVNLLPDHIIDDILEVSASQWNRVEREGFSIEHASEFLMIGTMNPEEGELRPQILDRFPLSVIIGSVADPELRKEIINRNLAFENDPEGFIAEFAQITESLKNQIIMARDFLGQVKIDNGFYDLVVKLCSAKEVDGHRADITIIKTARTYAAFEFRTEVELRHIIQSAKLVLTHRTRQGGLKKPITSAELDEFFQSNELEIGGAESPDLNFKISFLREGGLVQQEKKY